jgi:hypothetical protein
MRRHASANPVSQDGSPSVGVQYGGGGLDQAVDPNYRDPQSNQWNVTIERQLSNYDTRRLSYAGMHTYRLSITEDLSRQVQRHTRRQLPVLTSIHVLRIQTGLRSTAPSMQEGLTTTRFRRR